MSKDNNKVIDLVVGEDGTYEPKGHKKNKQIVKKEVKKYDRRKADNFIQGLDAGLDFVEDIGLRVDRFLKLRG